MWSKVGMGGEDHRYYKHTKFCQNPRGDPKFLVDLTRNDPDGDHPETPSNQTLPSWCRCGKCRLMPTPRENVCCRQRPCITTAEVFNTNVLNTDVLSIAIVRRSDDFADTADYTPTSYQKAAYHQWTMWQHGYLGRHNRQIVPSCVIWAVRSVYPAPGGVCRNFV